MTCIMLPTWSESKMQTSSFGGILVPLQVTQPRLNIAHVLCSNTQSIRMLLPLQHSLGVDLGAAVIDVAGLPIHLAFGPLSPRNIYHLRHMQAHLPAGIWDVAVVGITSSSCTLVPLGRDLGCGVPRSPGQHKTSFSFCPCHHHRGRWCVHTCRSHRSFM